MLTLISYDLHKKGGKAYEKISKRLTPMGGFKIQESEWLVPYDGGLDALSEKIADLFLTESGDKVALIVLRRGEVKLIPPNTTLSNDVHLLLLSKATP